MRNRTLTLVPSEANNIREAELVDWVRAGDSAAFEILFNDFYGPLLGYASSLCTSVEEARDVVCDVFASIWYGRRDWEPRGTVRGYFFRAVRNRCLNTVRDRTRQRELWHRQHPDDLPLPSGSEITVDRDLDLSYRWEAVRAYIEEMPPLRREAMRLRWIEKMSHAEVANVMGISVNAVQLHISLALKSLRSRFGAANKK